MPGLINFRRGELTHFEKECSDELRAKQSILGCFVLKRCKGIDYKWFTQI